ncbi:MAG: lipocalin-like domain-containing protein [Micropepsaceae bacterium]
MAKSSPAEAVTAYLNSIPSDFRPAFFGQLTAAAGRLNAASPERSATNVAVMMQLLGTAACYGVNHPTAKPAFPDDHAVHPKWGLEWYYLACNLEVDGTGGQDRIGVLVDLARQRAVSLAVQNQSGWSDEDAQIVYSIASATVATRKDKFTVRRRSNAQWPIKAPGSVAMNKPGDPFLFRCGPDVLQSSSPNVLPLQVLVDDGSLLRIELTVTSPLEKAYFLQGDDGLVLPPHPGMYYSWPQLTVRGSVTASGTTYRVSGLGWIDHQVLMRTPAKPVAPSNPATYFDGWSWCAFNLNDGSAFTAAGFQMFGLSEPKLVVPEGFHVKRSPDGWQKPIRVGGDVTLSGFIPMIHNIEMPTGWIWDVGQNEYPSPQIDLHAVPWYPRCDIETENMIVICETPVDLKWKDGVPAGVGVCETFDFEPLGAYQSRALAYLKTP